LDWEETMQSWESWRGKEASSGQRLAILVRTREAGKEIAA